ncbi:MAG: LPS export ABC transporter periplasmic protein LptC, partial [Nitrospirota bacterium]
MWDVLARRSLLTLSGALAAFLIYLLFVNADSAPTNQPAAPGAIESADAKISDFTFTQTKGDVVQWRVQAKQARLFEQEKRAVLSDVEVTLYGQAGKEVT